MVLGRWDSSVGRTVDAAQAHDHQRLQHISRSSMLGECQEIRQDQNNTNVSVRTHMIHQSCLTRTTSLPYAILPTWVHNHLRAHLFTVAPPDSGCAGGGVSQRSWKIDGAIAGKSPNLFPSWVDVQPTLRKNEDFLRKNPRIVNVRFRTHATRATTQQDQEAVLERAGCIGRRSNKKYHNVGEC